jgi:hypothetical protein
VRRYEGRREGYVADVTVDGRPLNPRLDLWNHSPTGFEWGYGGSGPAQLALAILADHLNDDERALVFYQRFKWSVIAELPKKGWTLTGAEIEQAIHAIRVQETRVGGAA